MCLNTQLAVYYSHLLQVWIINSQLRLNAPFMKVVMFSLYWNWETSAVIYLIMRVDWITRISICIYNTTNYISSQSDVKMCITANLQTFGLIFQQQYVFNYVYCLINFRFLICVKMWLSIQMISKWLNSSVDKWLKSKSVSNYLNMEMQNQGILFLPLLLNSLPVIFSSM